MFLSGLIVVTRNRYLAWGSIVFAVSALINSHPRRAKEAGFQGWSTVFLCLSALFASYFPLFVITNPVTKK
ncbi:hypothetical protein J132_03047 [Termitomyces sp. J132]|nr:hypothetical protein J132_03047 [Termitomyces sp. J132]